MASPLSARVSTALNTAIPTSINQDIRTAMDYGDNASTDNAENIPSLPFTARFRDSRGSEHISPLKPLKLSTSPVVRGVLKSRGTGTQSLQGIGIDERTPCKASSVEKRFPVETASPTEVRIEEPIMSLKTVMRDNEGFTRAMRIPENGESVLGHEEFVTGSDDSTTVTISGDPEAENFADDTAFSTFSAVPDMTMFARIEHIQTKPVGIGQIEGENAPESHSSYLLTSPPPRCQRTNGGTVDGQNTANTTNLILDFTEQFNNLSGSLYRRQSSTKGEWHPLSKGQIVPEALAHAQYDRTPSPTKHRQQLTSPSNRVSNLLDFDIPPPPTPRSMPAITPRELESLKSNFLFEISSLKASLSGREAEVLSLKTAVSDAEERVGECMEQVREERDLKEQLAAEKEVWEKRGREMELVLRNAKGEILRGEREREALEDRLEDSEKRREAAEIMAQEAESKMTGMRVGSVPTNDASTENKKGTPEPTSKEVEVAVENVARELHTLYKNKHETKVAALKKSYEGRWEKKVRELEAKVDELSRENEELKVGRDATMSGVVPKINVSDVNEELRFQAARDAKTAKELEGRLQELYEEVKTVKRDNAELRDELEKERIEKGELVAACDELLALQEISQAGHPAIKSSAENLRGSISRGSGLRTPNIPTLNAAPPPSESRVGKVERSRCGSSQGVKLSSGMGFRGGIMNSIEKMGGHKGRVE